jgi:hypothetical protein
MLIRDIGIGADVYRLIMVIGVMGAMFIGLLWLFEILGQCLLRLLKLLG